jgi:segregation and condensation protein B
MLTDETLKALLEGIIYIAPEPVTLDGMLRVLEGEERERVKAKLDELLADYEQNTHGIQIRQVANGYKFSTKAEHHETLRKYVKSLKPPIRLSKPALETLAVIAYRQPVTMPEVEEIRGVDSGGVIHTLLEKKLVVTSGRKSVVGRPILYRTSKDFLVHFGLKDVGELPSLKEFEELARRALGSEWAGEEPAATAEAGAPPAESSPAPAAPSAEPAPPAAGPPPEAPESAGAPASTESVPAPPVTTEPSESSDSAPEAAASEPPLTDVPPVDAATAEPLPPIGEASPAASEEAPAVGDSEKPEPTQ